jgi:S-adenosyl-L-methionine hydrolase (adenosine-forming)
MNRLPSGIITLATDFGTRDSYVATMKGVIYQIYRAATIVDLTHQILPQDLTEASLVLESCYRYFPSGTVHVIVVDPGVGTIRRAILVDTAEHIFVGPDNGVFSRIYASQSPCEVREIVREEFLLPEISDTFHGRDIFSPVAARLAGGVAPSEVGPVVDDPMRRDPPQPLIWQEQLTGEVIHVDSFGNIITNISRGIFESATRGKRFRIMTNGKTIDRLSRTYEDVPPGKALALFGSLEMLEIATHGGRADRQIGAGKGDPVQVLTDPL